MQYCIYNIYLSLSFVIYELSLFSISVFFWHFCFANICLLSHYFPAGKKMSQKVPDAIDLFNFWYLCAFAILHICVLSYIYIIVCIYFVWWLNYLILPSMFFFNCNVPTFIGFLVIQSFSYFLLLCCANCCYLQDKLIRKSSTPHFIDLFNS